MNLKPVLLATIFFLAAFVPPGDFITEQKKFPRVRSAFIEKGKLVTKKLSDNNISTEELNILIVAFKAEQQLEVYAKRKQDSVYKRLAVYNICSSSGELGPKRKQGDRQVPEGYYYIDRFNPVSNFHLSLGVSYPNKADRKKSPHKNLGGDIFIHGSCVTIGCMPMTDDKIKEIYLYAIQARQNGQSKIPVYIFPFRMTEKNFGKYKNEYKNNPALVDFWKELKMGYEIFEANKIALDYSVDDKGNYLYHLLVNFGCY